MDFWRILKDAIGKDLTKFSLPGKNYTFSKYK